MGGFSLLEIQVDQEISPARLKAVWQFVISRRKRREIQNVLIFRYFPGFPFDFAQGGEPFELRVSPKIIGLARNDIFVELRHSLSESR